MPTSTPRIIDAHNHVIPPATLQALKDDPEFWGVQISESASGTLFVHREGYLYQAPEEFWDVDAKLQSLETGNMDGALLCVAPPMFFYGRPADRVAELHHLINQGIYDLTQKAPDRFRAIAVVPMQDVDRAIDELSDAVTRLGMRGVEVDTSVNGCRLDEPQYGPFLEAVERLGVVLMIHPSYVGARAGLEHFYMTNTVGNPLEIMIAAGRLILGGTLDRYPKLQVFLVHGGGYLPYQVGRLDRAALVRPEIRDLLAAPSDYLRRFYFDTITFDPAALAYLISRVGPDRVMLGSDAPFDMRDPNPLVTLRAGTHDTEVLDQISGNVARIAFQWMPATSGAT